MRLIESAVRTPVTVAVGVAAALLLGLIAFTRVPVQMAPTVTSTVIAVTTTWENASPEEIESDVVEQQEKRLSEIPGLDSMTSTSRSGVGEIRLQFATGTDIQAALGAVDQKLAEVPGYPDGVDEPAIEDVDPESVDYIAWIGLASTDAAFDTTTLYDFMERRLRPRFERIPGVSEVGMLGARESELLIRVDPIALAQRGLSAIDLVDAIELSNDNFSGGRLPDGKRDIRVRAVGRFHDLETIGDLVIRRDAAGPVYLGDVAEVSIGYKEARDWARARGHRMPFFNFQLAQGGNLLETMEGIHAEVDRLNAPGGLLESHAAELGLDGRLELVQTYDASQYVRSALDLVGENVLIGALLATLTLLLFLRSVRTIGVIAIAIPLSVVAAVVILVALGRSINIVSLAGMAFATGMVVDNAIVVIENIFRHLEMGKAARRAAIEGAAEVASAVVASTATTLIVFLPILLIEEAAGQLFRDIALAIMAAVGVSLVVALIVIPAAAAKILKPQAVAAATSEAIETAPSRLDAWKARVARAADLPHHVGALVGFLSATATRRVATIGAFAVLTIVGIATLMPPLDYLPKGNRNVVFSVMVPPPDYNLDQISAVGERLEAQIAPAWQRAGDRFGIESVSRGDAAAPLPSVIADDGERIAAPLLDHYFLVSRGGQLFQAAIPLEDREAVDVVPLLHQAAEGGNAPDIFHFTFQLPLFRTGGTTGSAIKVDLTGDDLADVTASAMALNDAMAASFGGDAVTPEPNNFALTTSELRITPNDERLREVDLRRRDVGLAVAMNGDGLILPRQFAHQGELKDLKLITESATEGHPLAALRSAVVAVPGGSVVDLESLADVERVEATDRIRRVGRQRAVTLQITPPADVPLAAAIDRIEATAERLRQQGAIVPGVEVGLAGSAGNLAEIKTALAGDGTFVGFWTSSLVLALLSVYLLLVVLFQSWSRPLVILLTVPLATLGGFVGLAGVRAWSLSDRMIPVQNLDVLTLLGFVVLAGVVVNNAILIVHQTLNFMRSAQGGEGTDVGMAPERAVVRAVSSRVRPILMSTLTSVGGMLPLVFLQGSGSELYRGLGAVVVGGLVVSTVFTLLLVPVVLSVTLRGKSAERVAASEDEPDAARLDAPRAKSA
ncbi:MAG: efflux RND transporter permease subunit [Myxococcota bacterium]